MLQYKVYTFLKPIFSRPGQSQSLLYKQPHNLSQSVILFLPHLYSASTANGYKIDYDKLIKYFLNREEHQNCIIGSKVIAVLLDGGYFFIGGVA